LNASFLRFDFPRAIAAFYHKKQREMEELEANSEDAHLNSEWANPRGLKSQFTGIGDIKFRGGR
jgi:hypothetical protein